MRRAAAGGGAAAARRRRRCGVLSSIVEKPLVFLLESKSVPPRPNSPSNSL